MLSTSQIVSVKAAALLSFLTLTTSGCTYGQASDGGTFIHDKCTEVHVVASELPVGPIKKGHYGEVRFAVTNSGKHAYKSGWEISLKLPHGLKYGFSKQTFDQPYGLGITGSRISVWFTKVPVGGFQVRIPVLAARYMAAATLRIEPWNQGCEMLPKAAPYGTF